MDDRPPGESDASPRSLPRPPSPAAPAPLAAQRVTFFAGAGLGITIESRLRTSAIGLADRSAQESMESGYVVGIGVAVPLGERFEIGVEGVRHRTGLSEVSYRTEGSSASPARIGDASTLWQAKLAIGYRLPTRIPLLLSVGPAFVRFERVNSNALLPGDGYENWGVHAGAGLDLPINTVASFHISIDDALIVWDDDARADEFERDYEERTERTITAQVDSDPTHIIALRAGFSFGF